MSDKVSLDAKESLRLRMNYLFPPVSGDKCHRVLILSSGRILEMFSVCAASCRYSIIFNYETERNDQ